MGNVELDWNAVYSFKCVVVSDAWCLGALFVPWPMLAHWLGSRCILCSSLVSNLPPPT